MEANFWHQMWAGGVLGFHQQEMNSFLTKHWSRLGLSNAERVLVPLCGKSLDMLWLVQQEFEVLGVELNQQAVEAFLTENNLLAQSIEHEHFNGYVLDRMQLLCGDFFKLTAEDCLGVKAVYDRAAIVALPPEMRQQYALHLQAILPKGTQYLMVVMDYDQALISAPPFSVSEAEVRDLFANFSSIEKVEAMTFKRKGVATTEMAFVMMA
ncbi:MAG: thiopurine S-methyltransferase [Thiomicrorhabdus sp.]|nr:MAG: thiopurine S-methyltransferase [Thiomicrorhabdus sp.]